MFVENHLEKSLKEQILQNPSEVKKIFFLPYTIWQKIFLCMPIFGVFFKSNTVTTFYENFLKKRVIVITKNAKNTLPDNVKIFATFPSEIRELLLLEKLFIVRSNMCNIIALCLAVSCLFFMTLPFVIMLSLVNIVDIYSSYLKLKHINTIQEKVITKPTEFIKSLSPLEEGKLVSHLSDPLEKETSFLPSYTNWQKILFCIPTLGILFRHVQGETFTLYENFLKKNSTMVNKNQVKRLPEAKTLSNKFSAFLISQHRIIEMLYLEKHLIMASVPYNMIALCLAINCLFFISLPFVVILASTNVLDLYFSYLRLKHIDEIQSKESHG